MSESVGVGGGVSRLRLSWWEVGAMGVVLLVSLFLNVYRLGQDGYPNMYYAAAVTSMLQSWHNFFFVAFDPAGFISVDKPPLAFWLQVGSARVFGLSPWSVMLPQVLAGILAVPLLWWLVRRSFGPLAGVLAAASLAVMPISVVTNRNETMDSLLTLVLLLAAWAALLAAERGKLRWLLLAAFGIGIGFNIKMLDAYLVVPAFGLLYWFAAPFPPRRRFVHLALATVVMLAVSLCWVGAVDLVPASQRPFVGSSTSDSEIALAFFYNGAYRLSGSAEGFHLLPSKEMAQLLSTLPTFMSTDFTNGAPGILRLFTPPLSGQVGLLLPLALLGLIGVQWDKPSLWPLNRQQQGLALWGVWFLGQFIVFTSASFMHQYYTTIMAPALCALVGIGITTTWREARHKTKGARHWFLPVALLLTVVVQMLQLFPYRASWLAGCLLALLLVVFCALLLPRCTTPRTRRGLILLSLCMLLVLPTIWSAIPVFEDRSEAFPYGGPDLAVSLDTATRDLELLSLQTGHRLAVDAPLTAYLQQHQGRTRYLAVTSDSTLSATLIVATGRPVMATGGYSGLDQVLTPAQLQHLAATNVVRYVIMPQTAPEMQSEVSPAYIHLQQQFQTVLQTMGYANQNALMGWVRTRCVSVPSTTWHPASQSHDNVPLLDLYDCSATRP